MGLRDSKQISEEELSQVSGGVFSVYRKDRQRCCPLCESTQVESYQVGSGWRQRRMGRCKSCGYEAGWNSFL